MRYFKRFVILFACTWWLCPQAVISQTVSDSAKQKRSLWNPIRKLSRYIDTLSVSGIDRRYIDIPEKPWQVMVKGNINQTILTMKSTINGRDLFQLAEGDLVWEPEIKTNPSIYAGVWVGYRGYGLGYSWNVGGDKGRILTLGATGGSYGVNLRIHSFEKKHTEVHMAGNFYNFEEPPQLEYVDDTEPLYLSSPIKIRTLFLDAYYLFNGKHFSYCAAYDQSVIQKRSAGSLVAGAMYYYSRVKYDKDENAGFIMLMNDVGRVKQWQMSAGLGYAYNYVPFKGMLVSIIGMPMLTFYNRYKMWNYDSNLRHLARFDQDIKDSELDDAYKLKLVSVNSLHTRISPNIDARLSLTYQWDRFFVNAYGQFITFHYKTHQVSGNTNDWYVNTTLGVRF